MNKKQQQTLIKQFKENQKLNLKEFMLNLGFEGCINFQQERMSLKLSELQTLSNIKFLDKLTNDELI